MANTEGNRKIAKIRKNFGKAVFNGKIMANLRPSKLKMARLNSGLTQMDICRKLDLRQATYAAIETGKRNSDQDRASAISELVNKNLEDLFDNIDGKYRVKRQ